MDCSALSCWARKTLPRRVFCSSRGIETGGVRVQPQRKLAPLGAFEQGMHSRFMARVLENVVETLGTAPWLLRSDLFRGSEAARLSAGMCVVDGAAARRRERLLLDWLGGFDLEPFNGVGKLGADNQVSLGQLRAADQEQRLAATTDAADAAHL